MHDDITKIVKELVTYPNEEEWFEFKENWYQADGIGEYISSVLNAATIWRYSFRINVRYITITDNYDSLNKQEMDNSPVLEYSERYVQP